MQRTPARCSDRATVTILRGSAPTMMTVGASPPPRRGERAGNRAPLRTSAISRCAELLLENVGVDEELAGPAQELEFAVLAIHREGALHAASQLGIALDAHARTEVRVRAASGVEERRLARNLMEEE